ncbi:MAG TPA: hypothetical protein VIF62_01050 [Labilithrix sp.]|jgi:hypothetical protein
MLRRFLPAVVFLLSLTCPAGAAERTTITTVPNGRDLHVTVHAVTDYCVTHADTEVIRNEGAIRIVRGRPWNPSRCFTTRDLEIDVPNVGPGSWLVSYEQIPAVAPARPIRIAETTAFID